MTRLKQGRWLLKRWLRNRFVGFAIAAALPLTLCPHALGADFDWNLPKGFPRPQVPADNPMNAAKVELGRYLFYDKRTSVNGQESCGSCHQQDLAFTDGRAHAKGTTGELHPRSAMSLVNVAYAPSLTWANPALTSLEEQALMPMFRDRSLRARLKGSRAGVSERGAARPCLPKALSTSICR